MKSAMLPILVFLGVFLFLDIVPCNAASLPATHPTYVRVHGVYDRLVASVGSMRPAPVLQVLPLGAETDRKVAWFLPKQRTVTLQEEVVALCAQFGARQDDCIAVILGHELAHYFNHHNWPGDFGNAFADTQIGKKVKATLDTATYRAMETQADYMGGFYGQQAGFNPLGIAPAAFETMYKAFKLNEDLRGYPSLRDRKAIAEGVEIKLANLVTVFESAGYLAALGFNIEAAALYEEIAAEFPSREILNNAAVSYMKEALAYGNEKSTRFAFPFELDFQTRLSAPTAKGGGFGFVDGADAERLLKKADQLLAKALLSDPSYVPAMLNQAAVRLLQDRTEEARILFARIRLAEPEDMAALLVLEGIAAAAGGDMASAAEQFRAAATNHQSKLAQINLDSLNGKAKVVAELKPLMLQGTRLSKETIDKLEMQALTFPAAPIFEVPANDFMEAMHLDQAEGNDGIRIRIGSREIRLRKTPAGYGGESAKKIRLGSNTSSIETAYGKPDKVQSAVVKELWLYKQPGIIFALQNAKVESWVLFSVRK